MVHTIYSVRIYPAGRLRLKLRLSRGGEDFGVLRAGSAADDEGMVERAVLGEHGDAAEVEHGQHVGVADFVLQAEANEVELDRKSTRLNSSHSDRSRMPSSA